MSTGRLLPWNWRRAGAAAVEVDSWKPGQTGGSDGKFCGVLGDLLLDGGL